jgi:hypothetical protein
MIKHTLGVTIPLMIAAAYRMQPERFRGWFYGRLGFTKSTSHRAKREIREAYAATGLVMSGWIVLLSLTAESFGQGWE